MLTLNAKPAKDLVERFYRHAVTGGPRAFLNVAALQKAVLRRARALSPKKSGEFRNAWRIENANGRTWLQPLFRLVNDHPYALAIEYGSRGGTLIVPIHGKALAFKVNGRTVITKRVIRGATRPHGVLRRVSREFPSLVKKNLL